MLRLRLEATHETAEQAAEALDRHAGVVRLISTPALGRRGGSRSWARPPPSRGRWRASSRSRVVSGVIAAVGVAISVTTIPASAYLGVGLGTGEFEVGDGAIVVLAVNVAMLIAAGSATLAVQRLTATGPRSSRQARRSP